MKFDLHIGIDYSGAKTPTSRMKSLQVYGSEANRIDPIRTPSAPEDKHWNWTRKEIAHWLVSLTDEPKTFIAGIDHGFSFPTTYFSRYGIKSWDQYLIDFTQHWPTYEDHNYFDFVRELNPPRTGTPDEFRVTEKRTSSAKSVFRFDVQGQVAQSTHAGVPWLHFIRQKVGDKVHFWPFDGWEVPEGKSVITEVYPSIFRNRYARGERTIDQQDAYATARWLMETDQLDALTNYFAPPLSEADREAAEIEGWILGVY